LVNSIFHPENAVAAFAVGSTLPRISLRRRDHAGPEFPTGIPGRVVSPALPSAFSR
jgi:hypothetical protein